MSERSYTLLQQWLQQSAISDEELQQLSARKPYFSAAHLLLLKRLNAGSEQFATQKKLAALHVYNPIQLEAQTSVSPFNWNEFEESTINPANDVEPERVSIEEKEIETFESADTAPTLGEQAFIKVESVESETANIESQKEKETFDDAPSFEASLPVQEQGFYGVENNNIAAENKELKEVTTDNSNEDKEADVEMPAIKLPSFDLNAPANAAAGAITFEPFHTVDYFASQGIKLSHTEASNDRFGKQVKSFTEWLKTMKKLPTTAITHNTDGAGESRVANLAAHSLQNADVVTESMAEVWVKQGNIQKASELYNKLSLQNPSKKAYFAAKIESLKKPS